MTSENVSQYPEHDKLRGVQAESQAIGEFLEWLADASRYQLAEYFGFDRQALEHEKRSMLTAIQAGAA